MRAVLKFQPRRDEGDLVRGAPRKGVHHHFRESPFH